MNGCQERVIKVIIELILSSWKIRYYISINQQFKLVQNRICNKNCQDLDHANAMLSMSKLYFNIAEICSEFTGCRSIHFVEFNLHRPSHSDLESNLRPKSDYAGFV